MNARFSTRESRIHASSAAPRSSPIFMETIAIMIILVPILLPLLMSLLMSLPIDLVHFGIVLLVNLVIGQVHPPVGVLCFVAMAITKIRLALVGPDCPNAVPPIHACGYCDQLDGVDKDGCFPVPTGPGLGVTYDWDCIRAHETAREVFRL